MKKINAEKIILIIPVIILMITTAIYGIGVNRRLDEMKSVSAVVIHDVVVTDEKQRKEMSVYITPSGERYHLDGCEYLNDNAIKTTLEQAIKSGYESCAYCQP